MNKRSDRELVNATLRGQKEAFDVLAARYWRLVCAVGVAHELSVEDVEDVAQETFLVAYDRLGSLRAPDRFAPWLTRIAARLAAKLRRDRNRTIAMTIDEILADVPDPQDFRGAFEQREDMQRLVSEALASLSPGLRMPLVMFYFGGASTRDISQALAVDPHAIEQRLSRGRRLLREFFRRHHLEPIALDLLRSQFLLWFSGERILSLVHDRIAKAPGKPLRHLAAGAAQKAGYGLGTAIALIGLIASSLPIVSISWNGVTDTAVVDWPRPVAPREAPASPVHLEVAPTRPRLLIGSSDQFVGWKAAQPWKDTTLPRPAEGEAGTNDEIGIIENDFGVYKSFPAVEGTVTLMFSYRPPPSGFNGMIGLATSNDPPFRYITLIQREPTGHWFFVHNNLSIPAEERWVDLRIVYRTRSGTYDLYMDGRSLFENLEVDPRLRGRAVNGVIFASGIGGEGAPAYIDRLRVWAEPGEAGSGTSKPLIPYVELERPPPAHFTLLSGELNGQSLDVADPELTVAPNAPIRGELRILLHNTHDEQVVFPVIEVPTWGDRKRNFKVITPDAPAGEMTLFAPVELTAPRERGTYHLLVVGSAETKGVFIASGTSWVVGKPVWGRGDDVVDWSLDVMQEANTRGFVQTPRLYDRGTIRHSPSAAVAVRIVVSGPDR